MQRYIEQLLEDIQNATLRSYQNPGNKKNYSQFEPDADLASNHIKHAEQFLYGKKQCISEVIGIEKKLFPAPEQLTQNQTKLLVIAMESLWNAYNLFADLPDNLPSDIRYHLLRENWESPQIFLSHGENHIEFCDYNWEKCPFPKYCQVCKEFHNEHEISLNDHNIENILPTQEEIHEFVRSERKKNIEQIITSMSEKDYLEGVFNYCDRWCERCSFTDKCFLYAQEELLFPDGADSDIRDDDFWETIADIQDVTFSLIEKEANQLGNTMEFEEESPQEPDYNSQQIELINLSKQYSESIPRWFEKNDELFQHKSVEWELAEVGLNALDCIQTIHWYHSIIPTRTEWSIRNQASNADTVYEGIDMNGSSKVCIIAIENSMQAWVDLLNLLHECEDEILEILNTLSDILKKTERLFPDARAFVRPGFDENQEDSIS